MIGRDSRIHVYVVRWNEPKFIVQSDKNPVWVRCVEYVENSIFVERQLFISLSSVLVNGVGLAQRGGLVTNIISTFCLYRASLLPNCLGRSYSLDIVVRYESCGLILIVGASFPFGFPPAIVVVLFNNVKQISLSNGKLTLRLWLVVVERPIHPEKPHGDVGCPRTQAVLDCVVLSGPCETSKPVRKVLKGSIMIVDVVSGTWGAQFLGRKRAT